MDSYEINDSTCAVVSVNEETSKIVEQKDEYYVKRNGYQVMEDSCEYYGSSYDGRIKGTKRILGSAYKVPIVIEESRDLIFFPTEAAGNNNCIWIALNHIIRYEDSSGFTKVTFDSGKEIYLKMSISSFEMQVLRANRLASIIKKRKENK